MKSIVLPVMGLLGMVACSEESETTSIESDEPMAESISKEEDALPNEPPPNLSTLKEGLLALEQLAHEAGMPLQKI